MAHFDDGTITVVPTKRLKTATPGEDVKVLGTYPMKWTDNKVYNATVQALGLF